MFLQTAAMWVLQSGLKHVFPGRSGYKATKQSFVPLDFTHTVLTVLNENNMDPEVKYITAYMSPLFSSKYKRILEPILNTLVLSLVMAPGKPLKLGDFKITGK